MNNLPDKTEIINYDGTINKIKNWMFDFNENSFEKEMKILSRNYSTKGF
ncbi:MAG: hypothetical protein ACFFDH_23135 [Promethearchaeota archaeon]